MKVHAAFNQSFLGKDVRLLSIRGLGSRDVNRSDISLLWLFRVAEVNLDTVRVANYDTRTVITNSWVLEAKHDDKSNEPEADGVMRVCTYIFRELLLCNGPVHKPFLTVDVVIVYPFIIIRAFRCDTRVSRAVRLDGATEFLVPSRSNTGR